MSEHLEQVSFIHKAKKYFRSHDAEALIPLLFAIPNGGIRDSHTAGNLKMEGVRKGVPDLFFAFPTAHYHGLFIEMKYGKGRLSPEQKEMIEKLSSHGYRCAVCYGAEEALIALVNYVEEKA